MKNLGKILLSTIAIGLLACSAIQDEQTGVTITGNTASISGHVILDNEVTLSKKPLVANSVWDSIVVSLIQAVDTGFVVTSKFVDSSGGFMFDGLSEGVYSLEARLPNGASFTRSNISLKDKESLVVNLSHSGGAVNDSLITWELDITCGDSGGSGVLYGPWNPGTGAVVRLLEQSWERNNGMLGITSARGSKIAVQFPREVWEVDSSIQILVGLGGREPRSTIIAVDPITGQEVPEILWQDSIPNRRLKITWKGVGPECVLLDSVGLPHVSCNAYKAPEYSSMENVASEIGTIFRDIANHMGTSDSVEGYLFPDSIVRGGGNGARLLLEQKIYTDTSTSSNISIGFKGYLGGVSKDILDSIPMQVIQGLNADSIGLSYKISPAWNTPEYWNDVPGFFYDPYVTPFLRNVVPFDSSGSRMYDLELNRRYKRAYFWNRPVAFVRKFKEWVLVSQGGGCYDEYEYLLRHEPSGEYRVFHHWMYSTIIACD